MWEVFRYAEKDIVDEEGHIIYPAFKIYLYNCTCKDGDPNPKFKILSNFE